MKLNQASWKAKMDRWYSSFQVGNAEAALVIQLAELEAELESLEARKALLEAENADLRAMLEAKKTERVAQMRKAEDLANFLFRGAPR